MFFSRKMKFSDHHHELKKRDQHEKPWSRFSKISNDSELTNRFSAMLFIKMSP